MDRSQTTPKIATSTTWDEQALIKQAACHHAKPNLEDILGKERPAWSSRFHDWVKESVAQSLFCSEPTPTPLSRHRGSFDSEGPGVELARATVELREGAGQSYIWIEKHSAELTPGTIALVPHSGMALTVDEAEEFARTLLDAVAVLREPAPDPDAPIDLDLIGVTGEVDL